MLKSKAALQRQHAREVERLLAVIEKQNDRIMHLADRPWTLPPRPTLVEREPESVPDLIDL